VRYVISLFNLIDSFQGYERIDTPTNYYNILDVKKSSSVLDIRQAYKKLSKKSHPDKNPSSEAKEEFQKVKIAYDVRYLISYLFH
jgi:curved DNA-binding protein CbpA